MTPPREIFAGGTFEITSRAINRSFFFAPTGVITRLFMFLLGFYAKQRGIIVYGVVLMSNHYHLLGLDVRGNLPDFVRDLNSIFARALNVHHGRDDKIWSGDGYLLVRPINPEDVMHRMVYLAANPAAAGLVNRAQEFPGAIVTPGSIGVTRSYRRPDFFFSERGPWSETAEVTFEVPECLGMSRAEYAAAFALALKEREWQHRCERRAEGKGLVGPAACRAVTPNQRGASEEKHGRQKFSIACKDDVCRVETIRRVRAFREAYLVALEEWREDVSGVVFPHGTWWVRRYAGAEVRRAPD
ncbi:MAG: hypothetical protein ACJAYU_003046 [Bradymonadia bacterium]|jgi:hypothetical protein